MSASTSPKAPSSIPNITTLRSDLDYGDIRLPRCAAFIDDTNAFRRKFKTSRGIDGVDLHDWKSRDGQAGLNEMTVAYLDTEGNGRIFWPDDTSSKNYNKYQYSKDRLRILRLVKQLFFRLNQQQFRNHKYKHKSSLEAHAQDERGLSEQTAIDLDFITLDLDAPNGEPPLGRISTEDGLPESEKLYDKQHPDYNQSILVNADIYEVPMSHSPPTTGIRQFEAINQPLRGKRDPVPDNAGEEQQRKRQKRQPKPPLTDNTHPEAAKALSDRTDQQRKSSRPKKRVQYDEYRVLAEMERMMSPERFPTPQLHSSGSPPRASTSEASTITFKAPVTTLTQPEAGGTAAATFKQRPSDVPPEGESETGQKSDQSPSVATHGPSKTQGSDQLKPTVEQSSKSPTPSMAGANAGGPSTGSSKAKPAVNFMYRVLLSRTPRRKSQRWNPRGRFQDKTLAELLKELPFGDGELQGLTFRIESECMSTVEHILSDDEDSFASMKRYINMEIREWLRQQHLGDGMPPRLAVDILIEQMSQDHQQGVGGLDELELEW